MCHGRRGRGQGVVDTTISAGTSEATYYLVTHRDELSSDDSEPITVRFGVSGGVVPPAESPGCPLSFNTEAQRHSENAWVEPSPYAHLCASVSLC